MHELEQRSVVPSTYFDDPQAAYEQRRKDRKETKKVLRRRLDKRRRPSIQDLEAQNVVPRHYFATDSQGLVSYFDDPQAAYEQRKRARKETKKTLRRRLDQRRRPSIADLEDAHIVPPRYFEDPQGAIDERRRSMEDKRERLGQRLHHGARPSIADLKAEHIMPEDTEVIAELKNIAQKHQWMESAVKDLSPPIPMAMALRMERFIFILYALSLGI